MPIVINAADGKTQSHGSSNVNLSDVHKLKDLIGQAVQDQFELMKVRNEHGLAGVKGEFGQTFGDGETNSLKDEESKLGTEQRLLR